MSTERRLITVRGPQYPNLEEVTKLLQKNYVNGLYPCADWKDDVTPLCAAVACGSKEIFEYQVGADPNIFSTQGFHIIRLLLEGNANLNLGHSTPFTMATFVNRKDIARELLTVPEFRYTSHPYRDKLLCTMLKLSLETDQMKKSQSFFIFFCDLSKRTPEEIFNQYCQHFFVHFFQVTLFDWLLTVGHYNSVYHGLAIKWLNDAPNLVRYIEETIQHFPTIFNIQFIVVRNLHLAFQQMGKLPMFSLSLLPIRLDCLKKTMTGSPNHILQLLYTIIHKTPKQDNGLDADLTERLCKGIFPFIGTGCPTDDIARKILACLCRLYKGPPRIIASLGVTSVSECTLDTADETANNTLREQNERLTQLSDGQRTTTMDYNNKVLDHSSDIPDTPTHPHTSYLVCELLEYNLEEYLQKCLPEDHQNKKAVLKEIVEQILTGLRYIHKRGMLHGDLKPQHVLIGTFVVKLADCQKIRRLKDGEKPSSDIKDAGMLVSDILSYGTCLEEDELAKDLIEQMTQADPQDRPTVEEALNHPYFWNNKRRVDYLITLGKEEEAEKFRNPRRGLLEKLRKCTDKTTSDWKSKLPSEWVKKLDAIQREPYPETPLAFLRFIRNLYEHHPRAVNKNDLMRKFPGLLASFYKFARANKWNDRTSVKEFITNEVPEQSETIQEN